MQTGNPTDSVNDCAYVLSFLSAAFGTFPEFNSITLTYKERTGVSLLLGDLSERLFASADAVDDKQAEMEV